MGKYVAVGPSYPQAVRAYRFVLFLFLNRFKKYDYHSHVKRSSMSLLKASHVSRFSIFQISKYIRFPHMKIYAR